MANKSENPLYFIKISSRWHWFLHSEGRKHNNKVLCVCGGVQPTSASHKDDIIAS